MLTISNQGNSHDWGGQDRLDNKGFGAWHSQRPGAGEIFCLNILRWIDRPLGAWLGCARGHLVHPVGPVRGQKLRLLPLQVLAQARNKTLFSGNFFSLSCALAPGFDQRDFKARKLSELQSGNKEWIHGSSRIWLIMIFYLRRAVW